MKKFYKWQIVLFIVCLFAFPQAGQAFSKVVQAQNLVKDALSLQEKAVNLKKIGEENSSYSFNDQARRKLDEAIEVLAFVLGDDPRDQNAMFTLGTVYYHRWNHEKASEKFSMGASTDKMRHAVYGFYKIESNRLFKHEKYKESLILFRRACSFQPNNERIRKELDEMGSDYFAKGKNFLRQGRFVIAHEYFLTAKACNSRFAPLGAKKLIETADSQHNLVGQMNFLVSAFELDRSLHDLILVKVTQVLKNAKVSNDKNIVSAVKSKLKSFGEKDYAHVYATVWPPKTWQQVYKKTFVGVGYTGGDNKEHNQGGLRVLHNGIDIVSNDRITVVDGDYEIWTSKGWEKYKKNHWFNINTIQRGKYTYFRNKKGESSTVVVERLGGV